MPLQGSSHRRGAVRLASSAAAPPSSQLKPAEGRHEGTARAVIPRSSDNSHVYLHELRASVVRIFFSHRWLSPWWPGGGCPLPAAQWYRGADEAHPDLNATHPKAALLAEAVQRMCTEGWIDPTCQVAVWIDFSCANQDGNPAEELNNKLAQIIGTCDLMLTCVVDDGWRAWGDKPRAEAVPAATAASHPFESYLAPGFQENSGRGWCRLEMFFCSNVAPPQTRARLFGGELRKVIESGVRPHLVYGTRESQLKARGAGGRSVVSVIPRGFFFWLSKTVCVCVHASSHDSCLAFGIIHELVEPAATTCLHAYIGV